MGVTEPVLEELAKMRVEAVIIQVGHQDFMIDDIKSLPIISEQKHLSSTIDFGFGDEIVEMDEVQLGIKCTPHTKLPGTK